MTEIRIPGYSTGSDLGGEPLNWIVVNTVTGERSTEWNPAYVPPEPMPPALEALAAATEQRKQSQEEWEEALREAARHHSLRVVAPWAGVTYGRVAQIVGPKEVKHDHELHIRPAEG